MKTQAIIDALICSNGHSDQILDTCIRQAVDRLEELERQRDVAIKHIADWCVAIDVNGSGWDDWDEYYKDAFYREAALPEIRGLLVEAIESAKKSRLNLYQA